MENTLNGENKVLKLSLSRLKIEHMRKILESSFPTLDNLIKSKNHITLQSLYAVYK
jgi:hypothetical protein